jgi:hypothetical protein
VSLIPINRDISLHLYGKMSLKVENLPVVSLFYLVICLSQSAFYPLLFKKQHKFHPVRKDSGWQKKNKKKLDRHIRK